MQQVMVMRKPDGAPIETLVKGIDNDILGLGFELKGIVEEVGHLAFDYCCGRMGITARFARNGKHFHLDTPGEAPEEVHVVLVLNNMSDAYRKEFTDYWSRERTWVR